MHVAVMVHFVLVLVGLLLFGRAAYIHCTSIQHMIIYQSWSVFTAINYKGSYCIMRPTNWHLWGCKPCTS